MNNIRMPNIGAFKYKNVKPDHPLLPNFKLSIYKAFYCIVTADKRIVKQVFDSVICVDT